MEHRKILASTWRSHGFHTIGMVAVETPVGWRAYIGVVPGANEKDDEQSVAMLGAKLTKSEAMGFFPELDPAKFEE